MTIEKYLILDNRSVVGNCATWWGPDGRGYVCNIDDAGRYTHEQAHRQRDTDIPVPETLALAMSVRHVCFDHLREYIDLSSGNTSAEERMAGRKRVIPRAPPADARDARIADLEAEVHRLRAAAGPAQGAMTAARWTMIDWAAKHHDNHIPMDARSGFNELSIVLNLPPCDCTGRPAELLRRDPQPVEAPRLVPHTWMTISSGGRLFWKCCVCGAGGGSAEPDGEDRRDSPFMPSVRMPVSIDCEKAAQQMKRWREGT